MDHKIYCSLESIIPIGFLLRHVRIIEHQVYFMGSGHTFSDFRGQVILVFIFGKLIIFPDHEKDIIASRLLGTIGHEFFLVHVFLTDLCHQTCGGGSLLSSQICTDVIMSRAGLKPSAGEIACSLGLFLCLEPGVLGHHWIN